MKYVQRTYTTLEICFNLYKGANAVIQNELWRLGGQKYKESISTALYTLMATVCYAQSKMGVNFVLFTAQNKLN